MNKIQEIIVSWGIALNPDDKQTELAAKRLEICESCVFRSNVPYKRCTVCGCALKGKVYTPKLGACPKEYWNNVEKEWFEKYGTKS